MESHVKYGQEIGHNLMRIGQKLCKNQNLLMLLDNTDLDPLNKEKHPNEINGLELLNKLILFVPLFMNTDEQNTKSKIVLIIDSGEIAAANSDNENLTLEVHVFCPFETWLITGEDLRPFAIMSQIRQSLQDKRINGLGEITYEGFRLATLTEEMSAYVMQFRVNAFS